MKAARRFVADHIDSVFGLPGSGKQVDGIDGHSEVETALVELYRETGERRCLDLAGYFVDRFGHGLLGGEAYCQDRVPLRAATDVEGHAVRQLYLLAAAADLATETCNGRTTAPPTTFGSSPHAEAAPTAPRPRHGGRGAAVSSGPEAQRRRS
ncbi:DUF1680 family protein [Streptomyces africanus]|uniref:DUF1680 family protein n=1 Tax=Streptomyces africanus TaxID=231024 RepID=A0ABU0QF90_9ACTN|nr:DUF1680 family protein [Streptomyces africanus]